MEINMEQSTKWVVEPIRATEIWARQTPQRNLDDRPTGREKKEFVGRLKLEIGCQNPTCLFDPEGFARSLSLDHIVGKKVANVSIMVNGGDMNNPVHHFSDGRHLSHCTWRELLEEIGKCHCLCSGCHEKATGGGYHDRWGLGKQRLGLDLEAFKGIKE
jgi:hypothetical protein